MNLRPLVDLGLPHSARGWRARIAVAALACACLFAALTMNSSASEVFNPTLTFQTSTTRASSHPDARITIDNTASDQSIKKIQLNLPNGFMGSLAAASKCTNSDPANTANFGDCAADTKIGTVVNEAVIDQSTVRIKGDVFLATAAPANANTDPASIIIKVHPQVGAVEFNDVILSGRVQVRYGAATNNSPADAIGPLQGINTTVDNIPDTVTDDHYAPVSFQIKKVTLDLKSRLTALPGAPPLLTNPSSCVAGQVSASFTASDGTSQDADTVPYTATGCGTVKFAPTFSTTFSNPSAGSTTQMSSTITFPSDTGSGNGSLKSVLVKFPPSMTANFPAFGNATLDRCPSSSALLISSSFSPTACPPSSKVGSVTISTPLLPSPLVGDVYLIEHPNLPWLGIDVSYDPINHPTTPRGLVLRLVGNTATSPIDSTCGHFPNDTCQPQVTASFVNAPDAPLSSIELNLNPPPFRAGSTISSGDLLSITAAGGSTCQLHDDVTASFTGTAVPTLAAMVHRIQPLTIAGCSGEGVTADTAPIDSETSDTTPTFDFTAAGTLGCSIDTPAPNDARDPDYPVAPTPCADSFTPPSLDVGLHKLYIAGASKPFGRAFVIASGLTPDGVAPETAIDAGPTDGGSTTTATPQFHFSSSESNSTFDCAVDDAAFLPCASPYTSPALTAGVIHTFEVRATDPAGNIDVTSAKRTFTVDVPFAPKLTVTPSTNVARAHPDLDITIDSGSHADMKDLTLGLPDGFFGGLTGVAQLCTVAQAAANPNTCPAASQIGTVDTRAEVTSPDGLVPSDINIGGNVYLTESSVAGEPAGILIAVHAKISTVDLGYIQIPGRLAVREHAMGIDSVVVNIPNTITSVDGTTNFDLRSVTLHLHTGAGAPHELLTNPSSCDPASFAAKWASYDTGSGSTSALDSSPFQVTGCNSLGFSPSLTASVTDSVTGKAPGNSGSGRGRQVSANLSATLTSSAGDAGIMSASVLMPKPITMNVNLLPTPCSQEEYDLDVCPASSDMGAAEATTPLLNSPLQGRVYLLRAVKPDVTPRLGIKIRGLINTDIIAVNRFENATQLRTRFDVLPDVPLSSFTLNISRIVSTLNAACDTPPSAWAMTGVLTGYNGKTAPVNAPLDFSCDSTKFSGVRKRLKGNNATLSFSATAQGRLLPYKMFRFMLPRGVRPNKPAVAKKLVIFADGKKLSPKCFTPRGSRTIRINFCGGSASALQIKFEPGSLLNVKKAPRNTELMVLTTDTSGHWARYFTKL